MVPASWFLFTAAGVAGLLLYERGRYGPAAALLAFYSVSGLIGFAHYQSISPTDFDAAPEHVHRARHRVRCVDPGLRRLDRPCDAERPARRVAVGRQASGVGGRSPSGRGHAIGVTGLSMRSPTARFGRSTAKCRNLEPRVQPSAK